MRPRKEVLIISDLAHDGQNLAYVLRVRRLYDAWTLPSAIDRLPRFPACIVILCRLPRSPILSLSRQTTKAYPTAPVLFVALENEAQIAADFPRITRSLREPPMDELIEAIRILTERKRGPKTVTSMGEKVIA